MSASSSESIRVKGIQKSNMGEAGKGDHISIFDPDVLGGRDFEDIIEFSKKLRLDE